MAVWRLVLVATIGCGFEPATVDPGDASRDASGDGGGDTTDGGVSIPIVFVQDAVTTGAAAIDSVGAAFAHEQTAGNTNVVVVSCTCLDMNTVAVNDTAGNTYVAANLTTTSTKFQQRIYYAADIAGGVTTNTVTASFGLPITFPKIRIVEYAGLAKVDLVDRSVSASGSGAEMSSGTLSTTRPHVLLFAANVVDFVTTMHTPSFALRQMHDGDIVEDRELATIGIHAATAVQSQSGSWIMQLVAFNAER